VQSQQQRQFTMLANNIASPAGARLIGAADGTTSGSVPTRFFPWRDEWTLNVDFMDRDHRALAAQLSRLAEDLEIRSDTDGGAPNAVRLIVGLEEFGVLIRRSFRREEDVMFEADYPRLAEHKVEHDLLLAEYAAMMRELRSVGSTRLDLGALAALKQWLIGHALDADKSLAEFLHAEGKGVIAPAGDAQWRGLRARRADLTGKPADTVRSIP
jgi:hemerythrin